MIPVHNCSEKLLSNWGEPENVPARLSEIEQHVFRDAFNKLQCYRLGVINKGMETCSFYESQWTFASSRSSGRPGFLFHEKKVFRFNITGTNL